MLLLLISCTWWGWATGGIFALHAGIAEDERPEEEDAGFSFVPFIPLFPLVLIGMAVLRDLRIARWGTRIIAVAHAGLLLFSHRYRR